MIFDYPKKPIGFLDARKLLENLTDFRHPKKLVSFWDAGSLTSKHAQKLKTQESKKSKAFLDAKNPRDFLAN